MLQYFKDTHPSFNVHVQSEQSRWQIEMPVGLKIVARRVVHDENPPRKDPPRKKPPRKDPPKIPTSTPPLSLKPDNRLHKLQLVWTLIWPGLLTMGTSTLIAIRWWLQLWYGLLFGGGTDISFSSFLIQQYLKWSILGMFEQFWCSNDRTGNLEFSEKCVQAGAKIWSH